MSGTIQIQPELPALAGNRPRELDVTGPNLGDAWLVMVRLRVAWSRF